MTSLARSTDGGATFTPTSLTETVRALAVEASTGTLYVLTEYHFVKSTDGGETWIGSSPGGASLVVDPHVPGTVYAVRDYQLQKTTDGGTTWAPTGWPNAVTQVSADTGSPTGIYITTYPDMPGESVQRSRDGGNTWDPVGPSVPVNSLTIDPQNPDRLFAYGYDHGLHRSLDGGTTWELPVLTDLFVNDVAIDPMSPSTLFAATFDAGLWRSTDGGETWTAVGVEGGVVGALGIAVAPGLPPTIYAGTELGFFRTDDGGGTWTPGAFPEIGPRRFAVDPQMPTTLFGVFSGLYRSTNAGDDWGDPVAFSDRHFGIAAIAVDPTAPSTIYAGYRNCCGAGFVRYSPDGGVTWPNPPITFPPGAATELGEVHTLVVDPTDGAVYAATRSGFFSNGILRTGDHGATWTALGLGGTTAVAIAPSSPATLYAGTGRGDLYRSPDRGESWELLGRPHPGEPVGQLLVDPSSADRVFAVTATGVIGSGDGGHTWGELGPEHPVNDLAADVTLPNRLFAATDQSGVLEIELIACTSDTDCADGDACTADVCAGGSGARDAIGCSRARPSGFLGVDCLFAATLRKRTTPCETSLVSDLRDRLFSELSAARERVAAAGAANPRSRMRHLLKRADRRLRRSNRYFRRLKDLDGGCRAEISTTIRALRTEVRALAR